MPNQFRTPEFIKLKHSINSCKKYYQLRPLSVMVLKHIIKHTNERDLLSIFWKKEIELINY